MAQAPCVDLRMLWQLMSELKSIHLQPEVRPEGGWTHRSANRTIRIKERVTPSSSIDRNAVQVHHVMLFRRWIRRTLEGARMLKSSDPETDVAGTSNVVVRYAWNARPNARTRPGAVHEDPPAPAPDLRRCAGGAWCGDRQRGTGRGRHAEAAHLEHHERRVTRGLALARRPGGSEPASAQFDHVTESARAYIIVTVTTTVYSKHVQKTC